jgi:hypothetical protein
LREERTVDGSHMEIPNFVVRVQVAGKEAGIK